MQPIKKLFVFFLALTLCLFAGCNQAEKIAALEGSWYTVRFADDDTVAAVLQQIDLYEPELALIEQPRLLYCQKAQFRTDKTYTFSCDSAVSQAFYRSFFQEIFQQLFEKRAGLEDLYYQNFDEMTQDAFFDFYAQLYLEEDFDALLDRFAQDVQLSGGDLPENGTFELRGDALVCTTTAGDVKSIQYALAESGALTLTYSNAAEQYSRDIPTP